MQNKKERLDTESHKIYLDHAATTKVDESIVEEMRPYYTKGYGNASAAYELGEDSRLAIEKAREKIAECIHALPEEIYFTSGGTECDNWALKGVMHQNIEKGKHMITSEIEHPAILNTCHALERESIRITYLKPDKQGVITAAQVKQAIGEDTRIVSIMYANNEIGTIEPIEQIGKVVKESGVIFHTDAVQAFGYIPINMQKSSIDMMSVSSHKIYGPKGVGFLYIRKGTGVTPLIYGGGQERGMRSGTENVPGIIGLAAAVEKLEQHRSIYMKHVKMLRDYFLKEVMRQIPYSTINGSMINRLPNNAHISFRFIEAQAMLVLLNENGIYASAASACQAGSGEISHVLKAIDLPEDLARGSLRFSLGKDTTKEEIEQTVKCLWRIVSELRMKSFEYRRFLLNDGM